MSDGSISIYNFNMDDKNPYHLITRRIDTMKVRTNFRKDCDTKISLTKRLDVNKDFHVRAGAIIYTKDRDKTYFCLGVDTQSGDLTDFGGGVKRYETVIEGGLRELKEESEGIFGNLTVQDVNETLCFHTDNMAISFIPVEGDMNKYVKEFRKKVKNNPNPEVCDIVWLSKDELLESIHGRGRKMYIRVRRLLTNVTREISNL